MDTPSPDSNTTPVVLDKENKESGGWVPKTKAGMPYFSNKISEIFSLLCFGFKSGSIINKGCSWISSESKPNLEKMWLNMSDISQINIVMLHQYYFLFFIFRKISKISIAHRSIIACKYKTYFKCE